MPERFDSRPLVLRRAYTATMRATAVLEWRDQVSHGLHLFFIIAASVICRNVANQQLLEAPAPAGPGSLGRLYLVVALLAGAVVALVGWWARNHDARRVASILHLASGAMIAMAFVAPSKHPQVVIGKYVVMEVVAAVMLLGFGLMLGARMGPREARRIAARVGAGGIIGGLCGGAVLSLGATFIGSRELFLLAAAMAVAPVFWLPATRRKVSGVVSDAPRDRSDVRELSGYGRWVAMTTLLMVIATTLIDYEYRFAATLWLKDNELTAFFGLVIILAGATSIIFQLALLDRVLDKLGLFATASIMPAALFVCSIAFGLWPGLASLLVLKLVDSGTNMSVQQATGGLLLAPLGVRARAIWQGRIDGVARRGGQALTGLFLSAFPWPPMRVVPVSLVVCLLWLLCMVVTRRRYINLLTAMLGKPVAHSPEVQVYDGATLRLLEAQLPTASPARAAVILDLMEQAEHRVPDRVLGRVVENNPHGDGALLVIEHLQAFQDTERLEGFTRHSQAHVAGTALLALDEVDVDRADQAAKSIMIDATRAEELRALAASLLSGHDRNARALMQQLAGSENIVTRLAVAQGLGRLEPGAPAEVGQVLCRLAKDPQPEVARNALAAVGKHLSKEACEVAITALADRRLRGAAMRALADLGPPVVVPIAETLQRYRHDPQVASALVWALGQIGVAAGVEPLLDALQSGHTSVRLSAAVALGALLRRRPGLVLPTDAMEARYLPEIQWYAQLRDVGVCQLPSSAAGVVLRHSVRQRAQASLEILFRLFSLRYPKDSIQAIYRAITSRDRGQRQLALELLDTLLDANVRSALGDAIGEGGRRPRARDVSTVLQGLTQATDPFLAELARVVLSDLGSPGGRRDSKLTTRQGVRRSVVDQILELQSITLFNQASAEDLGEVAALVVERALPSDTVIYQEGDAGDAMYLLREGQVVLSRGKVTVNRLQAGEAFGIISVLDRLPRELTATTVTPCTLLVLKAEDLHQLLADRPLLMHSVFRALTTSIRNQIDRVSLGKRAED